MNRLAKTLVLSAAVAATTLMPVIEASAGERWRQQRPRHPDVHARDDARDDMLAAGLIGLAAGALVVGAIGAANQPPPAPAYAYPVRNSGYYPAAGGYYSEPRVVYQQEMLEGAEPWSEGWYDYCSRRYRSFDPRTGTYRGFDGLDHFCIAD